MFEAVSCIYILYWNIDRPYIGQTVNFHKRSQVHLRDISTGLHCNYKILQEYSIYKILPTIEILCVAAQENLNALEEQYIKEFDSIASGLNIISGGYSVGRGVNNSASVYIKDQLVHVFRLLGDPELSLTEISAITQVKLGTVKKI